MIPAASEMAIIRSKAYNKLLQKGKAVYHVAKFSRNCQKTILFILGCQRSGTTLMNAIFERDLNTKVYAEQSQLSSHDVPKRLRLNPLSSVKTVIDRDRAPIIILKPLVESQNTLKLLAYFEGSKALWLYRHYQDVAASNVKKWGDKNAIGDLKAIIERRPRDWRYENVSAETRDIVLEHFSEEMNAYDAAALYWFVRNRFIFQLNLDTNPRVRICKYERLITDPVGVMTEIYKFLDHDFPGSKVVSNVHSASINKGKDTKLTPQIDSLCEDLLRKLDQAYGIPINQSKFQ